jgi:hypothetical protein
MKKQMDSKRQFHTGAGRPADSAWLYDPEFWETVRLRICPMTADTDEQRVLTSLSRQTNVPVVRLKKQYGAWWRGILTKHHPGTSAIN